MRSCSKTDHLDALKTKKTPLIPLQDLGIWKSLVLIAPGMPFDAEPVCFLRDLAEIFRAVEVKLPIKDEGCLILGGEWGRVPKRHYRSRAQCFPRNLSLLLGHSFRVPLFRSGPEHGGD